MTRCDIEAKINELSNAIAQMTADLNMVLGRREAYKEMLAKTVEAELNLGSESNAEEVLRE